MAKQNLQRAYTTASAPAAPAASETDQTQQPQNTEQSPQPSAEVSIEESGAESSAVTTQESAQSEATQPTVQTQQEQAPQPTVQSTVAQETQANTTVQQEPQEPQEQEVKVQAAPGSHTLRAEHFIRAEIASLITEEYKKFLQWFTSNSEFSTVAWALNVTQALAATRKGVIITDLNAINNISQTAVRILNEAVNGADADKKIRFILAGFKYIPELYACVLFNRSAHQLSELQLRQLTNLGLFFEYWATYGEGEGITKRMNPQKSLTDCFEDPQVLGRLCSLAQVK